MKAFAENKFNANQLSAFFKIGMDDSVQDSLEKPVSGEELITHIE